LEEDPYYKNSVLYQQDDMEVLFNISKNNLFDNSPKKTANEDNLVEFDIKINFNNNI
jgi:hypothetical protein